MLFLKNARVQQMNRDQIKLKHCYSMTPIKGRRTIAWVTELFRIAAMAAYQEEGTETLELNPIVVRFVSRHAAYPTGWSTRRQQLLIEDFALAAEKEVSGHLARRSRRPGQSSNWTPAFPCGTTTGNNSLMSITRMSRAGDQRPRCSARMRREGSRLADSQNTHLACELDRVISHLFEQA